MADHGSRAHATWSASSTARNWNCPGSLTMAAQVAHLDVESEAAAWGTACHQVAEKCLTNGQDAEEYIDSIEVTKEHEFIVDEEMAETAQVYVSYVRDRFADAHTLLIEQRFVLDKIKPPFDAGGTADAVIYFANEKLLEVVDLKGGRGVKVDVTENKQLRTYALGAVLANPNLKVERVRSTIVQPRINHKDGAIRSEEYHVVELLEWANDLLDQMHKAKAAEDDFGQLATDVWVEKHLTPGPHCVNNFCPARATCPAFAKQSLDQAGVWFDDTDTPQLPAAPDKLAIDKLVRILDAADQIESYVNACRAYAHKLVESGVEVGEYILVDRIGRRRWKYDGEELVKELYLKAELETDDIYNQKIKSPAQIEKVLGKKKHHLIETLFETPKTGTNLVRKDKTTRKAAIPAVHQHFTAIE